MRKNINSELPLSRLHALRFANGYTVVLVWFGLVWFGLVWLGFCELGSVSKHNVLEFESLCSFPLRRIDLGAATQYPLGIPEV